MMRISDVPLQVYNRALDLYGVERESDIRSARIALHSAESRIDVRSDFAGISPFAQAVAEYMSLSGPFAEDGGEYAGIGGYTIE